MRRPDERETILQSPPATDSGRVDSPKADDDRTLSDDSAAATPEPGVTTDEQTQFLGHAPFLGDRTEVLSGGNETLLMRDSMATWSEADHEPPEPTIIDARLVAASPTAEAADTLRDNASSRSDATLSGPDPEGATTIIGAPGGRTVLAPAGAKPVPLEHGSKTMRPAGSNTIAERGDGSATVAQIGGAPVAGAASAEGANNYEFLEEIAQGGMGRIWRASDLRIRREVAFKELLPDALREPEALERFVEEAQVTGQLEHPSIVPVYELGRQDNGTPFYSMKLVAGSTFRDAIQEYHALPADSRERRLAFVKLLRNLVAVCNAVGFAHERGVLHRDLKPLNIMLGDFGETLVLDWGMAKVLGDPDAGLDPTIADPAALTETLPSGETTRTELELSHPSVAGGRSLHSHTRSGHSTRRHSVKTDARSAGTETQMGSIMGTPNYMAPEQALGLVDEFDARTDIYSLGAILYEMLTGQPPVPKGKITEKLKYIIEGRTPPPREVDATIPRPVEAICLKAMSRRKDERYETALALAADIEAYLADEPVSVFADPWYTRIRRWAKRHRTAVATTAAVAVVAVAAAVAWRFVEGGRVARAEDFVRQRMDAARQALGQNDFAGADRLLNEASARLTDMPMLAALHSGVQAQQASVQQLRREHVEQEVQRLVASAEAAMTDRDFARAEGTLKEALAMTAELPELREVQQHVSGRLEQVQAAIAGQKAYDQAQRDYARFRELADQARVFNGVFRDENPQQDASVARDAATQALAIFGLDGPNPLATPPAHLDEEQIAELRLTGYELCHILSQAEVTLGWDTQDAEREQVGKQALRWVEQAKAFGLETKSLLAREGGIFEWLGRDAEASRVRAIYDQTTPTLALDHYLLAEASRMQNDISAALDHYAQALHLDPDHFWATFATGRCHLDSGQYPAAIVSFTGCAALRPELPYTYGLRALAWSQLGRYETAEADFDQALASTHPLADALFKMGVLLNRGSMRVHQGMTEHRPEAFEQALADFNAAAELRPDRADPHLNLARTYWLQAGQTRLEQGALAAAPTYQDALQEATAAASRAPITSAAYIMRGMIHLDVGDTRQAVDDYQRAVALASANSDRARAYVKLGQLYHASGDPQTALANYDAAIENAPHFPEAYVLRGEVRKDLRRGRDAAADFVKFLELLESGAPPSGLLDPTPEQWQGLLAKAYRCRGELRVATDGDYRQALPDYIRSAELNPNSAELLIRRGSAYAFQAFELAEADFTDAIDKARDDPDPWNGRGYARVMQGRYQEGTQDAAQAVELLRKRIAAGGVVEWDVPFNAACVYSQAVDRVEEDRSLPTDQRATRADEFARRAIELLEQADQAAGAAGRPVFLRAVQSDRAIDPIREREQFRTQWKAEGTP